MLDRIRKIRQAVNEAEDEQLETFLQITQVGDSREVIRRMRLFAANELARRDVEKEQDED